jgi:hypothetical protein
MLGEGGSGRGVVPVGVGRDVCGSAGGVVLCGCFGVGCAQRRGWPVLLVGLVVVGVVVVGRVPVDVGWGWAVCVRLRGRLW